MKYDIDQADCTWLQLQLLKGITHEGSRHEAVREESSTDTKHLETAKEVDLIELMTGSRKWLEWTLEKTVQSSIGWDFNSCREKSMYVVTRLSEDFSQVHTIDGFFELDIDTICQVLSNKDLQVSTELDVFLVGLKWIAHMVDERRQFVTRVMKCVQFRYMSHKELLQCFKVIQSLEKYEHKDNFRYVTNSIKAVIREQALQKEVNSPRTFIQNQQLLEIDPSFFSTHDEPSEDTAPYLYDYLSLNEKENTNGFINFIRKIFRCKKTEKKNSTFGVHFEDVMNDPPLPSFVTRLCQFIARKGFHQEGIFTGKVELSNHAKEFFFYTDKEFEQLDARMLAELLKVYLEGFMVAVIPCDVTSELITAHKYNKHCIPAYVFRLRQVVNKLPRDRYVLLRYLIRFLVQVAREKDTNKMSTWDLADVFMPYMFGGRYKILRKITNDIMLYHRALFDVENPAIFKNGLQSNIKTGRSVGRRNKKKLKKDKITFEEMVAPSTASETIYASKDSNRPRLMKYLFSCTM